MNAGKGDSRPTTFPEPPARGTENINCTGLDAAAAMSDHQAGLAAQRSCPCGPHETAHWPSFPNNNQSHKKVDKPKFKKPGAAIDSRKASESTTSKFELCEKAHGQSIEGMISIPYCVLRRHPNIRRVVELQDANMASGNESSDPEIQALKNPVAPVNKDTTKELELSAIQNNTSLRIDLCFDDQLFFQPIKGRKGEEKQRRARVFWDCLSLELDAYRHALGGTCSECANETEDCKIPDVQIPSRLAEFFSALHDLIEMLVPEKDKTTIKSKLDVDELVRSSRTGVFDAVQFSGWLAQLLMTHCAPLRDGMARKMNQQISDGAQTNDMDLLVKGLETLLALLENMKLDVANHQVRSFKLLLIADTVPFLQDCFSKMQAEQQLDPKGSRKWFKDLQSRNCQDNASDFDIFVAGTVKLCRSPCPSKAIPATFTYDKDRLVSLRNELLDLTQLRICTDTFEELAMNQSGRKPTTAESDQVRGRLLQLMSAEDGTSEGVACHLDEIATEIARAAACASVIGNSQSSSRQVHDIDFQHALNQLEARFAMEQFNVMDTLLQDLNKLTLEFALQFQKLDTLQLSNAQRAWTAKRSSKGLTLAPEMEDIARRLAHIIVIHWAVWAKLVYLDDDNDDDLTKPILS